MDMCARAPEGKYMSTVKVGPKGQIVIPKEVRDFYGIEPGSTLILLADRDRGIALMSPAQHPELNALFAKVFPPDTNPVRGDILK